MVREIVVVGIGNTLLGDDGVGVYVVRRIMVNFPDPRVEVKELSYGAFGLLEALVGYRQAIIVDCITGSDAPAGTIRRMKVSDLAPAPVMWNMHTLNLRQLLKLGQELGLYLPKKIDIYAIAIEEANTFGEGCTPRISEAIPRAVGAIVVDLGLMVQ